MPVQQQAPQKIVNLLKLFEWLGCASFAYTFFGTKRNAKRSHLPPSRTKRNKFNLINSLKFIFSSKRNVKRLHFPPSPTKTNTNCSLGACLQLLSWWCCQTAACCCVYNSCPDMFVSSVAVLLVFRHLLSCSALKQLSSCPAVASPTAVLLVLLHKLSCCCVSNCCPVGAP